MAVKMIGVKQLADKLGCTEAHVTHMRFARAIPSIKEAMVIAEVSANELPLDLWALDQAAA